MTTRLRSWNRLLAVMLSISLACSMGTVTAYAAEPDSGGDTAEAAETPPDPGGEEDTGEPPDEPEQPISEEESTEIDEPEPEEPAPPNESVEEPPAEPEAPPTEDEHPAEAETPSAELPDEQISEEDAVPVTLAYFSGTTEDGLNYTVSGTAATITGCTDTVTELKIPASITADGTEYPVTAIKDSAFLMNKNLTHVDLGGLSLTIGTRAFCGCSSLTEAVGLDGQTALNNAVFLACTKLERITGLQNVTSIDTQALMNCPALTTLDGLNWSALTHIGQQAFASAVRNVTPVLSLEWNETTFSSLKTLGSGAFSGQPGLTGTLVLPDGVTDIPQNAFSSTGITAVYLPDSIQTISDRAFSNCKNLTAVQIGKPGGLSSRLTAIGKSTFSGDTAITSFIIESSPADVVIASGTTSAPTIPDGITITYTVEAVEGTSIYTAQSVTLPQAIAAASSGDTITADKSFLVQQTVVIPTGKSLTLTDDGKTLTILPDKGFSGPLFRIEQGASLTLDGTFIYKGIRLTGGVFAEVNGELTLAGGSITRVSSDADSRGAVLVNGGTFTMTGGEITACTFGNQYSGAVVLNSGSMHMTGGSISGNKTAADNSAGGVLVKETAVFTMDGGTISNNFGTRGAGVLVGLPGSTFDQNTAAKFVLNDGTISGNTATPTTSEVNAGGGGVFVQDNAVFEMNSGTISSNKATGNGAGGGVATGTSSTENTGGRFTMNDGTISDNFATNGGGVYSHSQTDAVHLNGGRIIGNTASSSGGGVYVSQPLHGLTIENALVTGNTAAIMGGGIWSCPTGTVTLGTHSAVFGNTANEAGDDLAFLLKESGYSSSFTGKLLGGGLVTWYRDNTLISGQWGGCGNIRYDSAQPGRPVAPVSGDYKSYALKAIVSAEAQKLTENAAKLIIQGNNAQRGGGIGTNGEILLPGEDTPNKSISITVRKIWSGTSTHPDTVTIHLLRTNANGTQTDLGTVILSEKCTDKDGNAWTYTFEDLDASYTYAVSEDTVSGFNTSISGNMTDGFTITNSKRSGGGGGGGGGHKPDPKPDPEPDPDPDPEPPIDIPDEPIPVDPLPPIEAPDEPIPEPESPVEQPERPSFIPRTGDMSGLWAALCALSAAGLAFLHIRRKHD